MKTLLVSTAMAAILAMPILAQDSENPDEQPADSVEAPATEAPDAQTPEMPETAAETAPAETDSALDGNMLTLDGQEIGADSLIGQNVYAPEEGAEEAVDLSAGIADAPDGWEDVGTIGDVLIDGSGSVNSVVIDIGGFLGMGERDVRVALADLHIVSDTDDADSYFILYTGNRAALEEADLFDPDAAAEEGFVPIGPDDAMMDDTMTDGEDTSMMADPASDASGPADRPDREALDVIPADAITAEEMKGARVYGPVDGWVGDISELVLNEDGRMSHVVVDVGGWLGIGVHPVALAFDEIDLRRENEDGGVVAFVDYTEAELEAMPEWTE